ncbi:MAG TPA: 16S rRNA (guanine(527)-N(7))-methyltransferase RsmG, partial [Lachnospiraceae bacterium]|nr:16S rRNA (guanine(527)-N(7))-methyltransferase RsmG [Lachnospiraceae bacterium]
SLSEYCIPFVKQDGCFISYKSGKASDEMNSAKNAIKLLGGRIENVLKFNLPDSTVDRTLITIKKIVATPKKYPRTAGKPSREPL